MEFLLKKHSSSELNINYLPIPAHVRSKTITIADDTVSVSYSYARSGDPRDGVESDKEDFPFSEFLFVRDDNGKLLHFDGDTKTAVKVLGPVEGLRIAKEWKEIIDNKAKTEKFLLKGYSKKDINYLPIPVHLMSKTITIADDAVSVYYSLAKSGEPRDGVETGKEKFPFSEFLFVRDDNGKLLHFDGDTKTAVKVLGPADGLRIAKEWKKVIAKKAKTEELVF